MRKLATVALLLASACAVEDSYSETSDSLVQGSGRYLVVFKNEYLPSDVSQRVNKAGGTIVRSLGEIGVVTAGGNAAFASRIAKDPAVLAVGPERVLSAPPTIDIDFAEDEAPVDDGAIVDGAPTSVDDLYLRGYQWDMKRIGAPAAWTRPLPRTPIVAVLDTGVMDDHPDLAGQVIRSVSTSYCSTSGGKNNTAGYPKYSTLIDFVAYPQWDPTMGCTPSTTGYEFHGTHVAGTVAAKFGGGRVVGVSPDAKLVAYKVFDRYRYKDENGQIVVAAGAFNASTSAAIIDAANQHYDVVTMSLGSHIFRNDRNDNASWLTWNRVINYANRAGTVVVSSAGNSALDLNGVIVHVPGDLPNVINVSATGWSQLAGAGTVADPFRFADGSHDQLAFYSNYGAAVDITAPGGDCGPLAGPNCEGPGPALAQYFILSTALNAVTGLPNYIFSIGTSMATPHVTAVAARVRALHPEWTTGDVRSFLKETAQDLLDRQAFGAGMVDADAATR